MTLKANNTYYLISLKHTKKQEKFMTLWRPNDSGYCFAKSMAGIYQTLEQGYHDSENTLPIKEENADGLFVDTDYDGTPQKMIPNNKSSWEAIGVKWTKEGLVRI